MPALKKTEQDRRIREFSALAGTDATTSRRVLSRPETSFDVQTALNFYYDNEHLFPPSSSSSGGKEKDELESVWKTFGSVGEGGEAVRDEGRERYLRELGLDPEGEERDNQIVLLALAEALEAPPPGDHFPKDKFLSSWKRLRKTTLSSQKDYVQTTLRSSLSGPQASSDAFRKVYDYAFECGKQGEARSISMDIALALWALLLPALPVPGGDAKREQFVRGKLTRGWLAFVEGHKKAKAVNKDLWKSFRDFALDIDEDFEKFDEDSAWPLLIDEFVGYAREHKKEWDDEMEES